MHLRSIAARYIPNEPLIKLNRQCYNVVPGVLRALGKVANPNPNVDAHSGVLLYTMGMKEWDYYTAFFATSRAMGCMAAYTWSRIMGLPIERPGSVDV
jgi:citrate synthase